MGSERKRAATSPARRAAAVPMARRRVRWGPSGGDQRHRVHVDAPLHAGLRRARRRVPGPNRGTRPVPSRRSVRRRVRLRRFRERQGTACPATAWCSRRTPTSRSRSERSRCSSSPATPRPSSRPRCTTRSTASAPPRGRRGGAAMPAGSPTSTPRAARARCCPARETRAGPPRLARDDAPSAGAQAGRAPAHYPRAGTGGGVPASYVSAEARTPRSTLPTRPVLSTTARRPSRA